MEEIFSNPLILGALGTLIFLILIVVLIIKVMSKSKDGTKGANASLDVSEKVFNSVSDSMIRVSRTGKITWANEESFDFLELEKDEILDKQLDYIFKISKEDGLAEPPFKYIFQLLKLKKDQVVNFTVDILILKTNKTKPVSLSALIYDKRRNEILLVITSKEQDAKVDKMIEEKSYVDSLTGINNKAFFLNKINSEVAKRKRVGGKIALFFMELQYFKVIEDSLGQEADDEIIKEAVERIKQLIPKDVVFSRWGRSTFTLMYFDFTDLHQLSDISKSIIRVLSEPFFIHSDEHAVSANIGVSMFPVSTYEADVLIKHADIAMTKAKEQGKNRFQFFTESLSKKLNEKIYIKSEIKEGIKSQQFEVYYNPIAEVTSKSIVAVESFLKWKHPKMGFLDPDKFLPIAKNMGIVTKLDDYLIEETFKDIKKLEEMGIKDISFLLNLTDYQIIRPSFIDIIKESLERYSVNPQSVKIQLDEELTIQDSNIIINKMEQLKKLGIGVVLSNYGKSVSSMQFTKKAPLSMIKLDKIWTNNLPDDNIDITIIKSVLTMSKSLNREVIADGVTNEKQFDALYLIDCPMVKGSLIGESLTLKELIGSL